MFVLGRTVSGCSERARIFLSPKITITPHTFVKRAQLGQLCKAPSVFPIPLCKKELSELVPSFSQKINSPCHISLGLQLSLFPSTSHPPPAGSSTKVAVRRIPGMLPVNTPHASDSPPSTECSDMLQSDLTPFFKQLLFSSRDGGIYSGRFASQVLIAWCILHGLEPRPRKCSSEFIFVCK